MCRYFLFVALLLTATLGQQDDLQFSQALETIPRSQVGTVDTVSYNADGTRMVTLVRNTVTVWALGTNGQFNRIQNITISGPLYFAQISADGSKIAAGGNNSTIHLWQLDMTGRTYGTPQTLRQPTDSVAAAINTLAFDNEGRLISGSSDGTVNVWRSSTNNASYEFGQKLVGHIAAVREVSSERRFIVTAGGTDGTVRIWNRDPATQNYRQVQQISSTGGVSVETARISQDEEMLVVGFSNGTIIILANTRRDVPFVSIQSMLEAHPNGVLATAISSDSSKLVSIGKDGVPSYWVKPALNTPFNRIKKLQEDANAVDFDRRNNIAVGVREGNGSQVVIYSLVTNCSQVPNSTKVNINKIDCECVAGTVWMAGACQTPQPVSAISRALTDGITLQPMDLNVTGMGLMPSITSSIFGVGGISDIQRFAAQGSTQGLTGLTQTGGNLQSQSSSGQSGSSTSTVTTTSVTSSTLGGSTLLNSNGNQNVLGNNINGGVAQGSTATSSTVGSQTTGQGNSSTVNSQTILPSLLGGLAASQLFGQALNGQQISNSQIATNGQIVSGQIINGQGVQGTNSQLLGSQNTSTLTISQTSGGQALGTQTLGTQVTGSGSVQPSSSGSQTVTITSQTSGSSPTTVTTINGIVQPVTLTNTTQQFGVVAQPSSQSTTTLIQPGTTTTTMIQPGSTTSTQSETSASGTQRTTTTFQSSTTLQGTNGQTAGTTTLGNTTRTVTTVTTRLICNQVKFSTGRSISATECECLKGYFFQNLFCYKNCTGQPKTTGRNIDPESCECQPNYVWKGTSCEQIIILASLPANQTIITQTKTVNAINCANIPFSTGRNVSLTACECIQNFSWVGDRCRRVCNSANSRNGELPGVCICLDGFVEQNNECVPRSFVNPTIISSSSERLFNCSTIKYALIGRERAVRCECIYKYIWDGSRCRYNCEAVPGARSILSNIDRCECREPGFIWLNDACVGSIDCARIPNAIPTRKPQQCDCIMDHRWENGQCVKKTTINCSIIPNAISFRQDRLGECICREGFEWNGAQCIQIFITPIFNCALIPRAINLNIPRLDACPCQPGYMWMSSKCLRNCTAMEGAVQSDPNNHEACICSERYIWFGNECILNCQSFPNAVGLVKARPQSCSCKLDYFWSNNSCIPDCKNIPNTIEQNKTVLGQCVCKPNFLWINNSCVVECNKLPMTNGSLNSTHCRCANDYEWIDNSCKVICSKVKFGTGKRLNTNECQCSANYIWYEGTCTRDCSRITGALKPDGTKPDECICAQAYIWDNQAKTCEFSCPGVANSVGTPKRADGSCECKSGYSWVKKDLTCVKKSAGSKLGLILPLAIGIPLGLLLLSGLLCLCCCIPGCCCGPKVSAPIPVPPPGFAPVMMGAPQQMRLQEAIMPPIPMAPVFVPLPTQKTFQTINTIETIPPVNSVLRRTQRSIIAPGMAPVGSTLGRIENGTLLQSIGSSNRLEAGGMIPVPPPQVINQVVNSGAQLIAGQTTLTNPVATSLVPSGITFASGGVAGGFAQGGLQSGILQNNLQAFQSGMNGGVINGVMNGGVINGAMNGGVIQSGLVQTGINQGAMLQSLHGIIQPPMSHVVTSPVVTAMPLTTVVQTTNHQSFADIPEYDGDEAPPYTLVDNKTGKMSYYKYPFGRPDNS